MIAKTRRIQAALALTLAALLAAPAALAHPPAYAPAYGWRDKNSHRHGHDKRRRHDDYGYYSGYTGREWRNDYGVHGGRCDRSQVGTVVGAVVGGAVGSNVARRDNRLIAILVGASIGAIVGREIDRDMDRSDRGCLAHSFEMARDGRPVRWDGARPGMYYTMTPRGGYERDGYPCRRFTLEREWDGRRHNSQGSACRVRDGEWRMVDD